MATALLVSGSVWASRWYNINASTDGAKQISAPAAHRRAMSGGIFFIDIRRPDEWERTGVAEGAVALDMRDPNFIDIVQSARARQPELPIALICARGVRAWRMLGRREAAGSFNVMDVPEGMLGSGAGPGWLERGLPLVKYKKG